MSGSLDFTGQPIQETYKRVVQYDNGILYDGTGSLLGAINITGSQAVTASYALTASYLENAVASFPFTGSAVDIISFVTFDSTNLYASAIKNLS